MKIAAIVAFSAGLAMAGGAFAQPVPSGGPDAKGNAPLKRSHTVNDGGAKRGANSFTEGQARQHILNSGYTGVTGLTKGGDGVWRGTAMKGGASHDVAMDFKGNVTEAAGGMGSSMSSATTGADAAGSGAAAAGPAGGADAMAAGGAGGGMAAASHGVRHHRHHRRHHHHRACVTTGPNGAACSGVDRNMNGVSDREDRAHH